MTRDETIKLARKAGFRTRSYTLSNGEGCVFAHPVSFSDCIPELEHFAALVAAAEREQCAQVCELIDTPAFGTERPAPNDCAAAIRARGNA